MSYFERPLPIGLIFGSFFAVFLPLAALSLLFGGATWLAYLTAFQAVGLGTTHFFVTLAVYAQSANLDYFASTRRNRIVYFAVPALIFLSMALAEALRFRTNYPAAAMLVFGTLRFLDFFHVGRQSVGMLQLWKRQLPAALPSWSRSAENAFFVGMAALQWETFLTGGRFASGELYALVPAAGMAALFAMIAAEHLRHALRAGDAPRRFLPLTYFAMQALCAAVAVYDTRLYLIGLTLHYVEYHVIMWPRCFRTPLSQQRAIDRVTRGLRVRPLLFYALLAAVVVLFELRNRIPAPIAPTTAFFVHLFDGIFLVHYFVEAFLWKFGNPHYRVALAPLYFGPWPPSSAALQPSSEPASEPAVPVATPAQPAPPEPLASALPTPRPRVTATWVVLCFAFLLSGASGLAFENLWFHQAGLAFGNSVWASSLVLSGFMAGMALGNWFAARRAPHGRAGLMRYAGLELLIGASGVALVYALPALSGSLAPLLAPLAGQPVLLNALRLLLAFLLLLLPSTAMGMTLPLLVQAAGAKGSNFGRVLGLLYGVNTAGAVFGVLGTELLLLPALGIRGSGWVAGGLNALAAALALALARRSAQAPASDAAAPAAAPAGQGELPFLLAAFGAGFALLGLEVVWLRFMLLFLNDTPVAFAVILALVLCGIALGGLAASVWSSLSPRAADFAPLVAYAAGAAGLAGLLLYPMTLQRYYAPDQDLATVAAVAAPLVLPTSLASGLLFALLGAGLRRVTDSDAGAAGRLAFANTIGAGCGSAFVGFLLLPRAGMERSLFVLFALYALIGICAALVSALGRATRAGGLALCAAALCFFPFGDMRTVYVRASAARWMTPSDKLAEVREGLTATLVHVVHGLNGLPLFDQLATNAYSMTVNDFAARRYMKLFVLLPQAIHPQVERALIVGYGIGSTAAALTASRDLEQIDVVDISSDVLALSRNMATAAAAHPLGDPRVSVHVEDGRYYLQATSQRYDLITGEPPPPVMAGVVNLYTQEYFELLRDRLNPGGIVSYWLPTMNISAATTRSIIRSFCAAFEDCSLWHGSARNFMLMGTREAAGGGITESRFARPFSDPSARDELGALGFELPEQLGALFIGDASYLRDITEDALPLTDDQPERMYQTSSREEDDALTWQFRDTAAARARFANSEFIARLFPAAVRGAAVRQFENQRLIDDLLFPGQTAARKTVVLHQVLHATPLRLPVLLLLQSDPDVERALRSAPPDVRERSEWVPHLAASAIADRDYERALALLERATDEQLAMPDLRNYMRYLVQRAKATSAADTPSTPAPDAPAD